MVSIAPVNSSSISPQHGFETLALTSPGSGQTPVGNPFKENPLIDSYQDGTERRVTLLKTVDGNEVLRVENNTKDGRVQVFDTASQTLLASYDSDGRLEKEHISSRFKPLDQGGSSNKVLDSKRGGVSDSNRWPAFQTREVLTASLSNGATVELNTHSQKDELGQADMQGMLKVTLNLPEDRSIVLPEKSELNKQKVRQQMEVNVLANSQLLGQEANQVRFINTLIANGADYQGKVSDSQIYEEAATVFPVDPKTARFADAVKNNQVKEDPLKSFRDASGIQKQGEWAGGALVAAHKVHQVNQAVAQWKSETAKGIN